MPFIDDDEKKDGEEAKDGGLKKRMEKEKVGCNQENMSRVLPAQRKFISFFPDGRYQPVKRVRNITYFLHRN